MMKMGNRKHHAEFRTKLCHRTQQRDRVCPARTCHGDTLARMEQAVCTDRFFDLLEHGYGS